MYRHMCVWECVGVCTVLLCTYIHRGYILRSLVDTFDKGSLKPYLYFFLYILYTFYINYCSIDVKRDHDQNNSYEGKHLIEGFI